MIPDSLARQFLIKNKHFISISAIEEDLGITGKSLFKWIVGKRPLPDKWNKPLFEYLFPMVDESNKTHQRMYKFDTVIVLDSNHILPEFKDVKAENLRKHHFPQSYFINADVVYFQYINCRQRESCVSIFSVYMNRWKNS